MKSIQRISTVILATLIVSEPCVTFAQRRARNDGPEVVRGPFLSATVMGRGRGAGLIAAKGIVVTVGSEKTAYVCYDTDLLRPALAWTGEFLNFGNTLTQIAWPPPPSVRGTPVFETKAGPGWVRGESLDDPRTTGQGPLPKDWAHYEGLFVNGDNVVLSYTVGRTKVLEMPGFESPNGTGVFTRTLNVGTSLKPMTLAVCSFDAAPDGSDAVPTVAVGDARYILVGQEQRMAVGVVGGPKNLRFSTGPDDLRLHLPSHLFAMRMKLVISAVPNDEALANFVASLKAASPPANLSALCDGGPAHWTETVVTQGTRSEDNDAYVADAITEPAENPYHAQTFLSGFDFFSDGRAAVCSFHGDVWVVSGIDDSLERIVWKRYATGLFQPLGLKIVKDQVYVLGRDQITRLSDLNQDGEADFYENFNNDIIVTENYHEFCLDLHTDRAGNFYFAKGSPWEPNVTSPSQGCLFKVSKDGSRLEIIATGLRAPNGMTVGPRDEITVSDNEGHWMPVSKLNWVERGGFYGMVPAAQRKLTFERDGTTFVANPSDPQDRERFGLSVWNKDGERGALIPTEGFDRPICWLPISEDNSSGGQVWTPNKNWGPLENRLLFMSYGKCSLFEVMLDEVDGVKQAAMVQFPLRFATGVMRGRINPRDGQVYILGLKGWQSSAARNGAFYRIRYTGRPLHMPTAFHATQNGVQITFATPLDKTAADADGFSVERWNYPWTGSYGTRFSASLAEPIDPRRPEVAAARLSPDGKTVFLEIADMKPSDQLKIRYSIDAADGTFLSQEIYATVYKLGPPISGN